MNLEHLHRLNVPVDSQLKMKLKVEARRREMGFSPFVRELLQIIVDDNLFEAILDDKK